MGGVIFVSLESWSLVWGLWSSFASFPSAGVFLVLVFVVVLLSLGLGVGIPSAPRTPAYYKLKYKIYENVLNLSRAKNKTRHKIN